MAHFVYLLKGLRHRDIAVLANSVLRSLLSIFTYTQNAPLE